MYYARLMSRFKLGGIIAERKPSSYYAVKWVDFKLKKVRIPSHPQEEYKKT